MLWTIAKNKYFLVGLLANEKAPSIAEVKFEGGTRTSKVPHGVTPRRCCR